MQQPFQERFRIADQLTEQRRLRKAREQRQSRGGAPKKGEDCGKFAVLVRRITQQHLQKVLRLRDQQENQKIAKHTEKAKKKERDPGGAQFLVATEARGNFSDQGAGQHRQQQGKKKRREHR